MDRSYSPVFIRRTPPGENQPGGREHTESYNKRAGRERASWLEASHLKIQLGDGIKDFKSAIASAEMIRVNEKFGYKLNGLTEIRLVKIL